MHVHILGICGTFMGGIAAIAKAAGHKVTGSDKNVYPPMSTQLQALGIELTTGFDAAQLAPRPDVVVVDFRLPGASGDEVTRDVLAASPQTTIVCLTAEATPDERLRVLAAGAAALVEKGGTTRELVDAIRSGRTP